MPTNRDFDETHASSRVSAVDDADFEEEEELDEWEVEGADDLEAGDHDWLTGGAWRQTGAAAAGLVFGLALGAGIALLFAPRAGDETRELLSDRARMIRGRAGDRLEDLRGDLGRMSRRGGRRMRRGVTRGKWAAEDMLYRAGW